jgi:hypothetical protein
MVYFQPLLCVQKYFYDWRRRQQDTAPMPDRDADLQQISLRIPKGTHMRAKLDSVVRGMFLHEVLREAIERHWPDKYTPDKPKAPEDAK